MSSAPDIIEPRSLRLSRWIGAGVLILALHAGAASYAMQQWEIETHDETYGAIAIEVALEMTADLSEPIHAPVGRLAEESIATPAAVQEQVAKVAEETPIEDLPSAAPEPEVVLQKQQQVEEDEPDETTEQQQVQQAVQSPTEARPESQASAPPPIEAPVEKKAAAPQAGSSQADTRAVLSWQRSVALHLNRSKRYPPAARSRGIEGEAMVRFVMDRSGHVAMVEVVNSSGSKLLDDESQELLQRAAPLPRPPPAVVGETLEFKVPIHFRLKK